MGQTAHSPEAALCNVRSVPTNVDATVPAAAAITSATVPADLRLVSEHM